MKLELTAAEEKCCDTMMLFPSSFGVEHEMCFVGAGICTGFGNATELHTMKCDEAMNSDDQLSGKVQSKINATNAGCGCFRGHW
jgi:hypothetical protein